MAMKHLLAIIAKGVFPIILVQIMVGVKIIALRDKLLVSSTVEALTLQLVRPTNYSPCIEKNLWRRFIPLL